MKGGSEYLDRSNILSTIKMLNFKKKTCLTSTKPTTVKRQSGKSKIWKNCAQNSQYLGKEERFIQGAVFKM